MLKKLKTNNNSKEIYNDPPPPTHTQKTSTHPTDYTKDRTTYNNMYLFLFQTKDHLSNNAPIIQNKLINMCCEETNKLHMNAQG